MPLAASTEISLGEFPRLIGAVVLFVINQFLPFQVSASIRDLQDARRLTPNKGFGLAQLLRGTRSAKF